MESDKTLTQKEGDSLKEPDVNQKFTADGGASVFEDLEAGAESGYDEGVGSIGVSRTPFKGLK
jgi:hypothetical protein